MAKLTNCLVSISNDPVELLLYSLWHQQLSTVVVDIKLIVQATALDDHVLHTALPLQLTTIHETILITAQVLTV